MTKIIEITHNGKIIYYSRARFYATYIDARLDIRAFYNLDSAYAFLLRMLTEDDFDSPYPLEIIRVKPY